MRAWLHLAGLTVLLAGCGGGIKLPDIGGSTIVETKIELCPVEIDPPDCPDFPPTAGVTREVAIAERDVIYERCRGWAHVVWAARQDCVPADD